jgi:hypothetical protein
MGESGSGSGSGSGSRSDFGSGSGSGSDFGSGSVDRGRNQRGLLIDGGSGRRSKGRLKRRERRGRGRGRKFDVGDITKEAEVISGGDGHPAGSTHGMGVAWSHCCWVI